jgi:hypothetical protein
MKALSLWQPWASAMALGFKWNETRAWGTTYRGELVICSAQRKVSAGQPQELAWLLEEIGGAMPYGCALCVVELFDMQKIGDPPFGITALERSMGNYAPGRFIWMTRKCRRLAPLVPVHGRQALFNLSQEEEKEVRAALNL